VFSLSQSGFLTTNETASSFLLGAFPPKAVSLQHLTLSHNSTRKASFYQRFSILIPLLDIPGHPSDPFFDACRDWSGPPYFHHLTHYSAWSATLLDTPPSPQVSTRPRCVSPWAYQPNGSLRTELFCFEVLRSRESWLTFVFSRTRSGTSVPLFSRTSSFMWICRFLPFRQSFASLSCASLRAAFLSRSCTPSTLRRSYPPSYYTTNDT